jgi:hypothetical protein
VVSDLVIKQIKITTKKSQWKVQIFASVY